MARARTLRTSRGHTTTAYTLAGETTLIASAARIRIGARDAGTSVPRKQEWQTEAFAFRRDVPEIGFALRYVGSAMSKLRLYVGYRPDEADPNDPPLAVDAETSEVPPAVQDIAIAELERLQSGTPTMASFLRKLAVNVDLVGECYLVGIAGAEGQAEQWTIRSISEVTVAQDGKITVKDHPGDRGVALREGLDTCIRMYLADEEWTARASAPMEYLLTDCRSLQVLTQQIYAESSSRLSAGILLVPNEFSAAPVEVPGADDPDADPFMNALLETLTAPVEDPTSAASIVPAVVRGSGEHIAQVRHMFLGREVDETLDERINGRINRIARGLDLPVEVIMGHMATTFANANQIDQDTYEDHLLHRCIAIVEMLTVGFLVPNLRDNPQVPDEWVDRIEVWFDPTALLTQPDPGEAADSGHEKMVISDAAWRRAKGFTEEDAPEATELIRRIVERKGIFTGDITVAMLRFLAFGETIEDLQLPLSTQPLAPPGQLPTLEPDETLPMGDDDAAVDTTVQPPAVAPAPADTPPEPPPVPPGVQAAAQRLLRLIAPQHALPPAPVVVAAAGSRQQRGLGQRLVDIDRDLRTRLLVASSSAVERALEKAGNRLKAKAGKVREALKAVPPRACAAHLGRSLVADAGFTSDELLAGAFDNLEVLFRQWGADAQQEALAAVNLAVGGFATEERKLLQMRQAADLDEAWLWFKDALQSLAGARLWDPDPEVLPGEFDPSITVPAGLVRKAMARMGGNATITTTDGTDAWLAIPGEGGVGTGDLVLAAYEQHGGQVEAYVWVYGPGTRKTTFEPHAELDGTVFLNFDDDVLANDSDFPPSAFYFPGDHAGCLCDFTPVLVDPSDVDT